MCKHYCGIVDGMRESSESPPLLPPSLHIFFQHALDFVLIPLFLACAFCVLAGMFLCCSTIRVWETQTWGCEKLLEDHAGPVYALTVLEGKLVSYYCCPNKCAARCSRFLFFVRIPGTLTVTSMFYVYIFFSSHFYFTAQPLIVGGLITLSDLLDRWWS